ncbi:RDD family protein [compost metagenome]
MDQFMEKELKIITPEQVQLQFQTAGIGSRAIAQLIDVLLLILVNAVLVLFLTLGTRYVWQDVFSDILNYAAAITILVGILLNVGYFIGTEAYMGGQTIGKRMIGLRVLQDNGQSATLLSVIIRNLFRLLDLLPIGYFLGGIVMIFSSRDKRIGDMVAGTIVVVELQKERVQRRKRIEKSLSAWRDRLPLIELDDTQRRALSFKDWELLSTWIEGLSNMSASRVRELSVPIAAHLSGKLRHGPTVLTDSPAYLIALYVELQPDWEY